MILADTLAPVRLLKSRNMSEMVSFCAKFKTSFYRSKNYTKLASSERNRDRQRQTETDEDSRRQTETDRDRQRLAETERDRQRQTEADTETETLMNPLCLQTLH